MGRDNTTIFRHLGSRAVYDHIFVNFDDGMGAYIWSTHPNYDELGTIAAENNCVMHLNLPDVADCDEHAYMQHHLRDSGDFLPDGWE